MLLSTSQHEPRKLAIDLTPENNPSFEVSSKMIDAIPLGEKKTKYILANVLCQLFEKRFALDYAMAGGPGPRGPHPAGLRHPLLRSSDGEALATRPLYPTLVAWG
jgi:hypothetical protein